MQPIKYGYTPDLCRDILKQPHSLIAGATGSGKSVLINALIYTALYQHPNRCRFILIDPKRVELMQYKQLPHTIKYASEPADILKALNLAVQIMENRFRAMQAQGQKKTAEGNLYIIIDEFADLMTTQKHSTTPQICRIAQLGRAAGVHLIIATQRPTKDIITGQIKVNIDCRVALRCPTAQDSRNIINYKGAELLPRYGMGYYLTPETMRPELWEIPIIEDDAIKKIIEYWTI